MAFILSLISLHDIAIHRVSCDENYYCKSSVPNYIIKTVFCGGNVSGEAIIFDQK